MDPPTVELTRSWTGKLNAVVDRFMYHRQLKREEKTYWRCNIRGDCSGRLTLHNDNYVSSTRHTHGSQPADVQIDKSKASLKNVASSSDITTKQIVEDAVISICYFG